MIEDSLPLATAATLDRHADARTAGLSAAEALSEALKGPADAVILFASFHHASALPEVVRTLRHELAPAATIGLTTQSVLGGAEELEHGPGMSVLALRFPGCRIRAFAFDYNDGPPEVWTRDLVRSRLRPSSPPRGAILFADPFTAGSDILPARIADALPAETPVLGGLASGGSQPGANVLVANDTVTNSGAVGLLLEGQIEMETLLSHGCRPVGTPMVATDIDGPTLRGLGGTSAVQAIQAQARLLNNADRAHFAERPLIGIATDPTKPRFGRGDFLVRTVAAANERHGTLLLNGPIRRGSTVQLLVRDSKTASEDLAMSLDLASMDPRKPAASLVVTCTARGSDLFGDPSHDAREIQRRLGNPPQAGFMATAEIAPVSGVPRLHGLGVAAALFRSPLQLPDT
jgi:small ligand-binding sensory domain FIST